jgi:tetratricopeptide (TPR) repeat protein
MFTQKRSKLLAMCGVLFSTLFLVACCCCYKSDGTCPSECSCCQVCPPPRLPTPTRVAPQWASQIDAGKNAEVVLEASKVIQAGREAPQYAQALLYRGMAEFKLGDLKSARDDLVRAQDLSDRLSKDEQLRLFRSQMMVLAKLGDKAGAEQSFQKALAIAPADQQDAIRREYENALKP